MLYASAVNDAKAEFGKSQAPSCESSGRVRMIKDLTEGFVISAYRRMIFFEVQLEENY